MRALLQGALRVPEGETVKVANTFWQRLQSRDRPATLVSTAPKDVARRAAKARTNSTARRDDARAQVIETMRANEHASQIEERAADALEDGG